MLPPHLSPQTSQGKTADLGHTPGERTWLKAAPYFHVISKWPQVGWAGVRPDNPHPGGRANSQGSRSLSQGSGARLLGTGRFQNNDAAGMRGACYSPPPACPHPKESLVPPQPGPHTPLTPLWEAFPSQPHPALTTAYSASPWQLDQSFPCVQLSSVYVLLCKRSQKASYSTVITSCESLSLLIKPVVPGYEPLPYRSAKKISGIEVTSLFLQLVSLEKQPISTMKFSKISSFSPSPSSCLDCQRGPR